MCQGEDLVPNSTGLIRLCICDRKAVGSAIEDRPLPKTRMFGVGRSWTSGFSPGCCTGRHCSQWASL